MSSMPSSPRVFLSYARKDGEAFASALRRRLNTEEPEITLWQDRAEMEGGVGWWKQIEEALDQVKFLIIVMTPAALQSEMTRKEWRYARQRGVNVYPVKAAPEAQIDYSSLPSWMRKAHFYDLEKEWETFVNYLKSDRQPPRVPFMAPDKPPGFVQRPAAFNQLLEGLLDPTQENPVASTVALHGSGGFGKTTLALALCHEERMITAFDDGILWITLGQQPNLVAELTKCYEALTGDQPAFLDLQQAAIKVAEKLENRNCLIVLDDVWKKSDLDPFFQGGTGCARLITTRQFEIASAWAGQDRLIAVDEMTSAEATTLMMQRLPPLPDDTTPFVRLAQRLGNWPLLIKLASSALASRLGRGEPVDRALNYMSQALDRRGVTAFDEKDEKRRSASVKDTLEISLGLLEPAERQALAELAIFPEDTDIPLSTVACVWRLDEFETEDQATKLANHALLDLDLGKGVISQHDEIRAYLRRELSDPTAVHARLVDAWGALERPLPSGADGGEGSPTQSLTVSFLNLPDPYAWRFLVYHLGHAGRTPVLRQLLFDWTWIQAKLAATDINALISDYDVVP
ncbi:MAG TPA: NB-ARC domain-containing protein, partial [Candidatus Competibacteraceae bacterium]|nr:NB-ARC domain-containing protein [Candidatus Competibacteraceae bacterium]